MKDTVLITVYDGDAAVADSTVDADYIIVNWDGFEADQDLSVYSAEDIEAIRDRVARAFPNHDSPQAHDVIIGLNEEIDRRKETDG